MVYRNKGENKDIDEGLGSCSSSLSVPKLRKILRTGNLLEGVIGGKPVTVSWVPWVVTCHL